MSLFKNINFIFFLLLAHSLQAFGNQKQIDFSYTVDPSYAYYTGDSGESSSFGFSPSFLFDYQTNNIRFSLGISYYRDLYLGDQWELPLQFFYSFWEKKYTPFSSHYWGANLQFSPQLTTSEKFSWKSLVGFEWIAHSRFNTDKSIYFFAAFQQLPVETLSRYNIGIGYRESFNLYEK